MTRRSVVASFLFLLVIFTIFFVAATRQRARTSHIGNTQPQQAASFDDRSTTFENPAAGFDSAIEASDVIAVAAVGFMVGAAVVLVQMLRRRFFPASVRPILLDL